MTFNETFSPGEMDLPNPFLPKDFRSPEYFSFWWYRRLASRVLSLFKWSGEAVESGAVNPEYLEFWLQLTGYACFIKHDGKLRGLRCGLSGLDVYGYPTTATISNHVIHDMTKLIGIDAVLVKNSKYFESSFSTVEYYARQLGRLGNSIICNLDNSKLAHIFPAENEAQAQQIRSLVDDVTCGKSAVIMKKDIFMSISQLGQGQIPVYNTASEYLVSQYMQDISNVLSEFLVSFGVNTSGANQIKAERNTNEEVRSNDQDILINRDYWLDPRKEACKKVSEIFGDEINVEIRAADEIMSSVDEKKESEVIENNE